MRTEQFLLFVNNDGSIGAFTGHRNEKLAGWVIWQTDGKFISATGITSFFICSYRKNYKWSNKILFRTII